MKNHKQGLSLIKFLFAVVIIIVFISLLGFNIQQDIVMNETVQTNFSFITNWLASIWENRLATPVLYIWNDIIIEQLWQPFLEGIVQGGFINQIPNPGEIQQ